MDLKTGYQTPEWASDLYQVPAWAIHTLARKMASIRMMTHGAILEAALKRYGKPKR